MIKKIFKFQNKEKVQIVFVDLNGDKLNEVETMDIQTETQEKPSFSLRFGDDFEQGSDVDLDTLNLHDGLKALNLGASVQGLNLDVGGLNGDVGHQTLTAEVDDERTWEEMESSDDEGLQIPKIVDTSDANNKAVVDINRKLNWEPKPSTPKYAMGVNKNLDAEKIKKASVTRQGKAEAIAKEKTELNQSKARLIKEVFKKEVCEKRNAGAEERAKKVALERKRVEEAKKKKEMEAEKLRQKAAERLRLEKEMKEKEKQKLEARKLEIMKAKEEAFLASKGGKN